MYTLITSHFLRSWCLLAAHLFWLLWLSKLMILCWVWGIYMLHKLVIKVKITIHIYESTYNPNSLVNFQGKYAILSMSIAVWRLKLLYECKLSTPNQGPFITFLNKNIVICAKITCEIHTHHIDMGWPVTFDSSGTAWISLITDLKGLHAHWIMKNKSSSYFRCNRKVQGKYSYEANLKVYHIC